MNYQDFVRDAAQPKPFYFLITDQVYLRDRVVEFCQSQLDESARPFDWSQHDLEDDNCSAGQVLARIRTLPWMSPRRWAYVRNAHKAEEAFASYLEDPQDRAVVILEVPRCPKKWPNGPVIEIGEGLRAGNWVRDRLRREGFQITGDAVKLLQDLIGDDLKALEMELEKLILWSWETRRIAVEDVVGLVAEARHHEIFELSNAVALRDQERALGVLNRLFASGVRGPQIAPLLYGHFKRLLVAVEKMAQGSRFSQLVAELRLWNLKGREPELRMYSRELLVGILLRLREADRLFKTSGAEPQVHLERLIIDTCRARSL